MELRTRNKDRVFRCAPESPLEPLRLTLALTEFTVDKTEFSARTDTSSDGLTVLERLCSVSITFPAYCWLKPWVLALKRKEVDFDSHLPPNQKQSQH